MPSRPEIIALLRSHPDLMFAADDQSYLCFAERLVEVLMEPTPEMIERGSAAIQAEGLTDVATAEGWRAMWAARFRGE